MFWLAHSDLASKKKSGLANGGDSNIKLGTVKFYKHFGRIGPVNAEEVGDDAALKHLRAGEFLFVLDPMAWKPSGQSKVAWVENFAYKKVKDRRLPKVTIVETKKDMKTISTGQKIQELKRATDGLFSSLWAVVGDAGKMKVRVSVEQQEELDDAESLEEVQKISYQDESSDVSDSLSMSEDDAGNISDGTDVSETETIRESDSMAEKVTIDTQIHYC